jgi:hydroxyacylglutathione hydrolase
LKQNIQAKLFSLADDVIVYPGHMEPTTVGKERRTNPFVGENGML